MTKRTWLRSRRSTTLTNSIPLSNWHFDRYYANNRHYGGVYSRDSRKQHLRGPGQRSHLIHRKVATNRARGRLQKLSARRRPLPLHPLQRPRIHRLREARRLLHTPQEADGQGPSLRQAEDAGRVRGQNEGIRKSRRESRLHSLQ